MNDGLLVALICLLLLLLFVSVAVSFIQILVAVIVIIIVVVIALAMKMKGKVVHKGIPKRISRRKKNLKKMEEVIAVMISLLDSNL